MINTLRELLNCPSLELHLDPAWGSDQPNHRRTLHHYLEGLGLDSKASTSISHTKGLGGFALSKQGSIGFDMELHSRVQTTTVARVCKFPEELSQAPSPAHVWCAKEAIFKALRGPHQPSVLSEISVGEWKSAGSHFETYCLLSLQDRQLSGNRGLTFKKDSYLFSIFFIAP